MDGATALFFVSFVCPVVAGFAFIFGMGAAKTTVVHKTVTLPSLDDVEPQWKVSVPDVRDGLFHGYGVDVEASVHTHTDEGGTRTTRTVVVRESSKNGYGTRIVELNPHGQGIDNLIVALKAAQKAALGTDATTVTVIDGPKQLGAGR